MKVVAFNGSPRPNGNTQQLIKYVFESLTEHGIETELVQVGGKLKWDPDSERFINNQAANKLLSNPPGRKPWAL